ncbi:ATP-dependent RNA helicase HrpA [Sporichthya sp.]|uniref:ATP-dependent RNA helicase HrpA n=1 Tax=Sporichthya sp. TaxID=65475 RepID=UPI0025E79D39|nr:ATP-dependent RNA helicase HrpA [Sporichthya sp.]
MGALRAQLGSLTLRDAHRLGRRLESLRRKPDPAALASVAEAIATAAVKREVRAASVPAISYPEELPISARRADIAAAIRDHQVVVVAGETGSGKTTQLPKICLELGRGVRGLIGHTQPRRLAARTVADRIAEELGTSLGDAVGYTIRFNDRVGPDTLVKLMTDGILLAEIQRDRQLLGYDTLIIDEAHERSLNVDFILGYLRELLPSRPDLKVVITSATIDPQRFARHFSSPSGDPAPIIEVSGRTYPVEIRYRPLVSDTENERRDDRIEPHDMPAGVCDAVEELHREGRGDVLVFLSGEREIRDTADALKGRLGTDKASGLPVEILPLYARLSNADQHRVFAPHSGRRVVLATNVAETSLTVPGIRYVVDAGTARISRYSTRRKVQRLPIEAVSQASANQRAGRCGRVAEGICIRLYAEEDYLARPEFTEPEILRTNLASVILQMTAIGLGDIAAFPFVDPPDKRSIADGVSLLEELGALGADGVLTPVGRKLAQLPVDPRIGRMILEADRYGVLREVIVIAAALSIQDPRERPVEAQEAARAKHARFADPTSDFLSYLNLWTYLREQQQELSSAKFRKLCTAEYLHYMRVREWQDLVAQLREVSGSIGLRWLGPRDSADLGDPQKVHLALLTGLLTHIGNKDTESNEFLGTRNMRFSVFPGSALGRKPPKWVMAAELVETSRLFARTVAKIEPEWVEPLAEHLIKRNYSEPHWERNRGAVVAYERVTLHGLTLIAGRKVDYARIDPGLCRELFIRHALVEGDWRTHHTFFAHNQTLRAEVEDLENRSRRRGLLVDDETLFAFYDARVPAEVVSGRHFDTWWKKARRATPALLDADPESLLSDRAGEVRLEDFPDTWTTVTSSGGAETFALSYQFEPGADADGVTVQVPLPVLNRLSAVEFGWQVPGLRADLVTALIRALPKAIRRSFVPAPDHAAAVLTRLDPAGGEALTTALERELGARNGVRIDPEDWDWDRVPAFLRMTFRVEDERGRSLGEGKDLPALAAQLAPKVASMVAAGAAALERPALRGWPSMEELPRTHEHVQDGRVVAGYPTLVAENGTVALRVLADADAARAALAPGTRRLLLTEVNAPVKAVLGRLSNGSKLALAAAPHANGTALFADCADAAVDAIVAAHGGPVRSADAYAALLAAVRAELPARFDVVVNEVATILTMAQEVDAALARAGSVPSAVSAAVTDLRAQYEALLFPGFVTATGAERLPQLTRYLRGISRRLDKFDPERDAARMAQVAQLSREYAQLLAGLSPARRGDADVVAIRWMLEELRISLFAQSLGTAHPVSEKRILAAMDAAETASRPGS